MFSREGDRGNVDQILHEFQLAQEVILCPLLGRAYVVVSEHAVSLAEQLATNASARSGWGIKVVTGQELDAGMEQAVTDLRQLDGIDLVLAKRLMGEGVLSYLDLAGVDPPRMAELVAIPLRQAENLVRQAQKKVQDRRG